MMRRFLTVDVFTDVLFGGNPLAVVLDAEGLSGAQMQSIAREFRYSETTFVLPARDARHTAQVRIFTATKEVPFAGHPNIGTALVLARLRQAEGRPWADEFIFEEAAGLVPVRLQRSGATINGAELTAPERLSVGPLLSIEATAECLGLSPGEICTTNHPPRVLSVGLPFLVVELRSRNALAAAKPDATAHQRELPPLGTDSVYAYFREPGAERLHARMFAPLDDCIEDPATGSAAGATIALLSSLRAERDDDRAWQVEQGHDMGRPSRILGRTLKRDGVVAEVRVAGNAVQVMNGLLHADSARDHL